MTTFNTHCHHCGTRQGPMTGNARQCLNPFCQQWTYLNPLPVAVALVPIHAGQYIENTRPSGLLVIRRGKEGDPGYGKLALPGGFIGLGEPWREALVREVREETGLTLQSGHVSLFDAVDTPRNVLIFGLYKSVFPEPQVTTFSFTPASDNDEVSEVAFITEPIELAFPAHTEAARRFFESLGK